MLGKTRFTQHFCFFPKPVLKILEMDAQEFSGYELGVEGCTFTILESDTDSVFLNSLSEHSLVYALKRNFLYQFSVDLYDVKLS